VHIDALGISVTQAAVILGVQRQTLNNLVNGKAGISPEMAIRALQGFWQ
jgi:addiction module HigA family antidote